MSLLGFEEFLIILLELVRSLGELLDLDWESVVGVNQALVGVLKGLDGLQQLVFGLVLVLDGCLQLHNQLLTVGTVLLHLDLLVL